MRVYTFRLFLAIGMLLVFLFNTNNASAEDWEIVFRDGDWDTVYTERNNAIYGGTAQIYADKNAGVLEWFCWARDTAYTWAEIKGFIGKRFTYEGYEDTAWVAVNYSYYGRLYCDYYGSYNCKFTVELYDVDADTLMASKTMFDKDHRCDDLEKEWVAAMIGRFTVFPCELINSRDYEVRVCVHSYVDVGWIGKYSKGESDFHYGFKHFDLDEMRVWCTDKEAYTNWAIQNHPNDDDFVVEGEILFNQPSSEDAIAINFSCYNKDSKINAFEVWVKKFDHLEAYRDPETRKRVSGRAWGNNIPEDHAVFLKVRQYIEEKNSLGWDPPRWEYGSTKLLASSAPGDTMQRHYWEFFCPYYEDTCYVHPFRITNYGQDTLRLRNVSFLASMNPVDYICGLDFDGPYFDIDLGMSDFWEFLVPTDSAMVGGFIYFKYDVLNSAGDSVICNLWGGHEILPVAYSNSGTPAAPEIFVQVYPNPFNPVTKIKYTINNPSHITLKIYDASGKRVKTLYSGFRSPGSYTQEWQGDSDEGRKVVSGVYFLRLTCGGASTIKKIVILK